jgi:catechol 2,3-dioxygenase-like lactoylglutathione lyase family enzyme
MPTFSLSILYVADPISSARFYAERFGVDPVEQSATFAMLPLPGGGMLGLWRIDGISPPATPGAAHARTELAFTAAGHKALAAEHEAWARAGVVILEPPTDLDFGLSFVAADPDGHRIRLFVPAEAMP